MGRAYFRIACILLLVSSTFLLFSTHRKTTVTRVVQELHQKVTVSTDELLSSATEWYEQADLPFAPGLAYLKGANKLDSNSPSSTSYGKPASSAAPPPSSWSLYQKQKDAAGLGHLSSLCRDTPWNPNITLRCHSSCGADQLSLCGGFAEARNRIQTCIRLAIDAGAGGSLIIPPIALKGVEEKKSKGSAISNSNARTVCPSALFDFAGLQKTIGNWCPGLKIRTTSACRSDNDPATLSGRLAILIDEEEAKAKDQEDPQEQLQRFGKRVKTLNLASRWHPPYLITAPKKTTMAASLSAALSAATSFRGTVQRFLKDAGLATEPVVLRYGDPYLAWSYERSRELATLRHDLFTALRHNASLVALGQAVREYMAEETGEEEGRYIGVHLLGGERGWAGKEAGSVEAQMKGFVEAIQGIADPSSATFPAASPGNLKRRGVGSSGGKYDDTATLDNDGKDIRTVYVSCSNATAVEMFRETLQPLNYTVYDKWSLLRPAGSGGGSSSIQPEHNQRGNETLLAQLHALDPDARDAVEYEVLVRARYWVGVTTSPLSAMLAYARGEHAKLGQDGAPDKDADLDWFERYVYPSSGKSIAADGSAGVRTYEREMEVRGDRITKLLAVSGDDIMDYFP
ncbi:hypothetical protein PG995_011422 [Apiospora arundinis]